VIVSAGGVIGGIATGVFSNPFKLTVAQVAARVAPSVVSIRAAVFRDRTSEGSGFFYGRTGHIVTNAHVLARATSVTITDASGQVFPADLEGIDQTGDFAELRTSDTGPKPLVAAKGDLAIGSAVVVIGNPFGVLPNTVTEGLVAGTDRQFTVEGRSYNHMIQTDAVANPGTSGGPMVNMSGELLGMVTAGGSGYTFAIPWRAFDSDVASWEAYGNTVALGPPLISASAKSLIVHGIGSGWNWITDEAWGQVGWHEIWTRPPNYYGGSAVSIYLEVEPNESFAMSDFKSVLSQATGRGYTNQGGAGIAQSDESLGLQHVVPDQVTYEVIWRDRNCVGILYLGSGIPPAPDVSIAAAEYYANQQESPIAANPS
jgi:hypothetical protein